MGWGRLASARALASHTECSSDSPREEKVTGQYVSKNSPTRPRGRVLNLVAPVYVLSSHLLNWLRAAAAFAISRKKKIWFVLHVAVDAFSCHGELVHHASYFFLQAKDLPHFSDLLFSTVVTSSVLSNLHGACD